MHTANRLRNTVRGSPHSTRPVAPDGSVEVEDLTGDVTFVGDVEITQEVRPGGRVSLSYFLDFGNLGPLFSLDPNFCLAPGLTPGVNTISQIEIDGQVVDSNNNCTRPSGSPVQHSFLGPTQEGVYDVTIVLIRPSDGATLREVDAGQLTITSNPTTGDCPAGFVRDPSTGDCVPSGGGGGGGGGDGLPGPLCFLDGSCSTGQSVTWAAAGAIAGVLVLNVVLD